MRHTRHWKKEASTMNLLAIIRDRISEKPIITIVNDVNDAEKSHDAFEIEDLNPLKQKASAECPAIAFSREKSEISAPAPLSADDQTLIDWFLTATMPTQPFDLDSARRVLDPTKFFDSLRREVAGRQSSPRWRCGATQADLRTLKTVLK